MPKIIKIDPPELKIKHNDCGAVISYYPNEVKSAVYHDYGGGSDIWYYIICPHCDKKIEVKKPKNY
mgnify:FL=1